LSLPPLAGMIQFAEPARAVTILSRLDRAPACVLCFDTIGGMSFSERSENKSNKNENLRQQFATLRQRVHQSMQAEEKLRLKENPRPTEEELHMAAFKEWLEPQVRAAIAEMYKKGYAPLSISASTVAVPVGAKARTRAPTFRSRARGTKGTEGERSSSNHSRPSAVSARVRNTNNKTIHQSRW
jgi:hypothetical protein